MAGFLSFDGDLSGETVLFLSLDLSRERSRDLDFRSLDLERLGFLLSLLLERRKFLCRDDERDLRRLSLYLSLEGERVRDRLLLRDSDVERDLRLMDLEGERVRDRLLRDPDLERDLRLLDLDLDLCLDLDLERDLDLSAGSISSSIMEDASLTRRIALSTSFLSLSEDFDAGLTMAFLEWLTLSGRPPKIAPLYCKAVFTALDSENSTKANLVGWVSSPDILTYLISPQPEKNAMSCSAESVVSKLPTYTVLLISSILLGSTLVNGGGVGRGAGIVSVVANPGITVETTPGTIGT